MDKHTAFEQAVKIGEDRGYKKGFSQGYEVGKRDAVVHGYWEKQKSDALLYWRCSCCKKVHYLDEPNADYCPGCGARMDA